MSKLQAGINFFPKCEIGELKSLPGIVLSRMKATEPPTNMAVVRSTFNTWSISTIPEKYKEAGLLVTKKKKVPFKFLQILIEFESKLIPVST